MGFLANLEGPGAVLSRDVRSPVQALEVIEVAEFTCPYQSLPALARTATIT
jgi:hypothetical protein